MLNEFRNKSMNKYVVFPGIGLTLFDLVSMVPQFELLFDTYIEGAPD